MNTDEHGLGWEEKTRSIIGCAYKVSNTLGVGFLEKVYENALAYEIRKSGLQVRQQDPILVRYEGIVVGKYEADLIVDDTVIVEAKVCRALDKIHMAQCMNYLKATLLPVCLLMNFGTSRVELRRILNPAVPEAWVHAADHFIHEEG